MWVHANTHWTPTLVGMHRELRHCKLRHGSMHGELRRRNHVSLHSSLVVTAGTKLVTAAVWQSPQLHAGVWWSPQEPRVSPCSSLAVNAGVERSPQEQSWSPQQSGGHCRKKVGHHSSRVVTMGTASVHTVVWRLLQEPHRSARQLGGHHRNHVSPHSSLVVTAGTALVQEVIVWDKSMN